MRLDVLLFKKGIYPSREKAKQAIEEGRVFIDGKLVQKPSSVFDEDVKIDAKPFEYVSRGGFKLEKALAEFKVDLKDKIVLDIGASTGGFTDVCLKNGAKKVFAVDVGEGQLSENLKNDKRVENLEKTNFLTLNRSVFASANFVVMDVSFVSLTLFAQKLSEDFEHIQIIALIKPQFEVGLKYARQHQGIVKDEKTRLKTIEKVKASFIENGFVCEKIITSPIKGGDGNIEYLAYFKK